MSGPGPFERVAAWVERRAPLVVLAWLVAGVGLLVTAPSLSRVGSADEASFLPGSAPSRQAEVLLRRAFPDDPSLDPGVVVLRRRSGLTDADRAFVARLVRGLGSAEARRHVRSVQSATTNPELAPVVRSADGKAELLIIALRGGPFTETANRDVAFVRRYLAGRTPAGLDQHFTGLAAVASDQTKAAVESFDRTALVTVLLVLGILLLVYRSVIAPLVSLVSIGLAFLVARGVVGLMAEAGVKIASIAETFMVVMVFGAGTDYCLFVISRFREELRGEQPRPEVLRRASRIVGPVIAASAATVILGFLAFYAAELGIYRSIGPAMGIAIAITLAAGLTLTPALLRLAGRFAFWPGGTASQSAPPRWERMGSLVGRRPAFVLIVGVTLLALPAAGLLGFRQSFNLLDELPRGTESRRGFQLLSEHYPGGMLAPVYLVVKSPESLLEDDRLAAVDGLTDTLGRLPGLAEVRSITQPAGAPLTVDTLAGLTGGAADLGAIGLDPDKVDVGPLFTALGSPAGLRFTGPLLKAYPPLRERLGFFLSGDDRVTRLAVAVDGNPYDNRALTLIGSLGGRAQTILAGGPLAGAEIAVGGPAAFFVDIRDVASDDFWVLAVLVLAAVFGILAVLLRSLLAPVYLLASVVLSYLATLGLTVLIFQSVGGAAGISFWVPPFLLVILVALGADYNIFIASRIREEADRGAPLALAAQNGLVLTGRVITSAGLILAGTFGALLLVPLPIMRQIGFAIGLGILIDTFIVRSLIVPSVVVLLGRRAFWPAAWGAGDPTARRWGLAGAGATVVAGALVGTLVLGGANPGALAVPAGPAGLPAGETADGPAAATTSSTMGTEPGAATSATSERPARAPSQRTATGAHATPPATRGAAKSLSPSSEAGLTSTTSTAVPEAPAAAPTRSTTTLSSNEAEPATAGRPIAVPVSGRWRYRVDGTRRIGLAGSDQPFAEDVDTAVTKVGGDDGSPLIKLVTDSSAGHREEQRRYGPGEVQVEATEVSTAGFRFGGRLDPPQLVFRWPAAVGSEWSGEWTSGGTRGRTRSKLTGTRRVAVGTSELSCQVVESETRLSGDVEGTQRLVSCWVPALGMSIDDDEEFSGTYRGVQVVARQHSVLIQPA